MHSVIVESFVDRGGDAEQDFILDEDDDVDADKDGELDTEAALMADMLEGSDQDASEGTSCFTG